MRYLWLLVLLCTTGCVFEPHRRLNEHVRLRGESIAANEAAPGEVRVQGAEVAMAASALQKQAVPAPRTPVVGTSAELATDIAKAGTYDAVVHRVRSAAKGLLDRLISSSGAFGAVASLALGAAGWLARKRALAVEAGNRLASAYREHVPDGVKQAVDVKLAEIMKKFGLPENAAQQFVGWENTPD